MARLTIRDIQKMRDKGEPITMLTAYDATSARLSEAARVPMLLVGDTLGMVIQGHDSTIPVTLDQMIYHASSVVKAVERAFVIVDIPFGSYQGNSSEALRSAIRIMKESGAHAVKMEGGSEIQESVVRILSAGVPVMGHLGLTPQSIFKFGTYTVRAKEEAEAAKLIEDAKLLEECGCFGIVLEKIPAKLAKKVAESITIPVIGIGAGPDVDGQVLVMQDMLGITKEFKPRFLRRYADLYTVISDAVSHYIEDVKAKDFPNEEEKY